MSFCGTRPCVRMGELGDDKAVPTLREWVAVGKPIETRQAAINSPGAAR